MTRQRPLFFDQIVESPTIIFGSRLAISIWQSYAFRVSDDLIPFYIAAPGYLRQGHNALVCRQHLLLVRLDAEVGVMLQSCKIDSHRLRERWRRVPSC